MTDESYDMATIEGCIGWGLFLNPPERRRLEAELAALRAVVAAVEASLGPCWGALCRCVDEFEPGDTGACEERRQDLYGAVGRVLAALAARD